MISRSFDELLSRRNFMWHVAATGAATLALRPLLAKTTGNDTRPPFRVIYSNDTTHILSCLGPQDRRGTEFTDELLRKSITEATGADAHFLQPGLGWIPWWKSNIYPVEEHYAWLRENFGIKGVPKIDRYLLGGGDMLATLVETCREMKVAPFLSFRLNDGHHVRDLSEAIQRGRPSQNMARHYWENYQHFRLGRDLTKWEDCVFDWVIPEVWSYKFSLIEEACANYDISGLELDFLRHWTRFGSKTGMETRRDITTEFVRRIRTMLDQTASDRELPRRWLCVRVPANAEVRPQQGIDLLALKKAGVDMFNLSHSYFTRQDDSVQRAREKVGDQAAIYLEMTHTTMTGPATARSGTQPFLRTTDQQFYTTARLAYELGATGVSLFNFPYYRYHVTDTIGPFHKPPFQILPRLKDRDFLKQQSQWYFLSSGRNDPVLGERRLPAILKRAQPQTFELGMIPVKGDRAEGLLRLRSDETIGDRKIEVQFNGVRLAPVAPVTSPLPHPYKHTWLGEPNELACFSLPAAVPIRASNKVEILVRKGVRVRLIYLDVTLP